MKKLLLLIALLPLAGITQVKVDLPGKQRPAIAMMKKDNGKQTAINNDRKPDEASPPKDKVIKDSTYHPLPPQNYPRLWSPQFLISQPFWFIRERTAEGSLSEKDNC